MLQKGAVTKKVAFIALFLVLAAITQAHAELDKLTVGVGYARQDIDNHDRDHYTDYEYNHPSFENGTVGRISLSWKTPVRWVGLRTSYERAVFDMESNGKTYSLAADSVSVSLVPTYNIIDRLQVYAAAGLGAMSVNREGGEGLSRVFGAGANIGITDRLGLNLEVSHNQGIYGSHGQVTDMKYGGYMAGIYYQF